MFDKQENKLSMYRVVEKLLSDNSIIWTSLPAFVTTKTNFSQKIVAIQSASQKQQAIITGISTDKSVLKTTLADICSPIAALSPLFEGQGNQPEVVDNP